MGLSRWDRIRLVAFAHPIELALCVALTWLGAPLLLDGPAPQSVDAVLPGYAVVTWAASLTVGGLVTGVGLLAGRWVIERSGLLVLVPAIFAYVVILLSYQHTHGLIIAGVFMAVGVGLIGRVRQERRMSRFEALYLYFLAEEKRTRGFDGDG